MQTKEAAPQQGSQEAPAFVMQFQMWHFFLAALTSDQPTPLMYMALADFFYFRPGAPPPPPTQGLDQALGSRKPNAGEWGPYWY